MIEDILQSLLETLQYGIYGFFDFILWLISVMVKLVLMPVDFLFKLILPDLSSILSNFSNSLIRLSAAPFSYFFHILPPITKTVLVLWLTLMISYYTIIWTYRGIILIPKVINKIKFW